MRKFIRSPDMEGRACGKVQRDACGVDGREEAERRRRDSQWRRDVGREADVCAVSG